MQAQWAAHGNYQLTNTDAVGISEFCIGQVPGCQLYQCHIIGRVVTNQIGVNLVTVASQSQEVLAAADNMAVRNGVAVWGDQKS